MVRIVGVMILNMFQCRIEDLQVLAMHRSQKFQNFEKLEQIDKMKMEYYFNLAHLD